MQYNMRILEKVIIGSSEVLHAHKSLNLIIILINKTNIQFKSH